MKPLRLLAAQYAISLIHIILLPLRLLSVRSFFLQETTRWFQRKNQLRSDHWFMVLSSKKYHTIYADGFTINVEPSADYVEEKIPDPNDETILDTDIKNITSINDIAFYEDKFIGSKTFWSLWSSSIGFAFLLLLAKYKLDNYNPNLVAINRKKANKLAMSKLKKANNYLKANDKKAFYNEIVRSLWDYVSLKLNMLPEDLSKENIQEKLLVNTVSEQTATRYINLINKSEMAVYSPMGEAEMQKDFNEAKEIIIHVESEIV